MRDTLAPDGVFVGIVLALFVVIFAREIAHGLAALPRWWRWRFRRDPVTGITGHEDREIRRILDALERIDTYPVRQGNAPCYLVGTDPAIGPDRTSVTIRTASGRVGVWSDVGPVVRVEADSAADALEVFLLGDLTVPRVTS